MQNCRTGDYFTQMRQNAFSIFMIHHNCVSEYFSLKSDDISGHLIFEPPDFKSVNPGYPASDHFPLLFTARNASQYRPE